MINITEGDNLIGWIIVPENSQIIDIMGINPIDLDAREIQIRRKLWVSEIPYFDKPILDEPRMALTEFYKCADFTARHCVKMIRENYQGKIFIEFLVSRNNYNYKVVAKAYTEGENLDASKA